MNRLLLLFAVMALVGLAPSAQANIQISYTIDGLPPVDFGNNGYCTTAANSLLCDSSGPQIELLGMFATANVVGTPSISFATGATSNVTNLTLAGHHLHIDVVAWGFTMPITPPALNFSSSVGGSVTVPDTANTLSFLSCVDQTNGGALPIKTGCPGGAGSFSAAVLKPNVTGLPTASYNASTKSVISPLVASYALDEEFDFWISGGSILNFSANTNLTPVPEPMSIALLGGVVLLTSRLIRRKQNQAS